MLCLSPPAAFQHPGCQVTTEKQLQSQRSDAAKSKRPRYDAVQTMAGTKQGCIEVTLIDGDGQEVANCSWTAKIQLHLSSLIVINASKDFPGVLPS